MKNLTITLREDVAEWLRVEAAKAGSSMSAFVGGLLETRMGRGKDQMAGLEFFLSGPGFPGISADLPKREDIYDREALRRHEHPDLCAGSGSADEKGHVSEFAEADDRQSHLDLEPPKSE